jgi:TolB-like protein/DNA-binding SARP family transcriptional activator/Flp pilus assembly protein TadD
MIRLRTLGALDLRGSDEQELRAILAQPKRVALLAYLALARPRGPQRRDTLVALFWPEHDAEHARNSLSQSIHVLRRSLDTDALVSHNGDTLSVDRAAFWCDAVAFEETCEAGRAADAVELYRGDLLEGFHIADTPEFDRWLEAERTRLGGLYAKALETIAEEREAAGDGAGAATWWRRLATRDPYNTRVALRLMRALSAAGDPAGAIQHARVHELLLSQELDIAPDPEIGALVRELQRPAVRQPDRSLVDNPVRSVAETPAAPQVEPLTTTRPFAGTSASRAPAGRRTIIAAGLIAALIVGGGALAVRTGAREPSHPLIRSLAVLPFENLSDDSAHQSFTDGIHDVLITELARYPELSVISRTSVLQYKGTRKSLSAIARELKVDGVVEGALLREGGRVRITAQLVHGASDRHLWAQRYERDLRDVFLLQGELAEAIAREVNVAARPLARVRRDAAGPVDSAPQELYLRELYLRGRHAELNRSFAGVQTAKEYYRRAIEQDSTFALGYAGLAGAYGFMADYDYAPARAALDTARIMARKAVALDSTLSETRTALAVALGDAGAFGAAEREFRRAIELGPSDARAHYWYSVLLVALGRGEEALREAQRAQELDPFAPRGLTAMLRYATFLITGQRPYRKLAAAERFPILKAEPGEPWARAHSAFELADRGRCHEARPEILRARQLAPESRRMLAYVASVHWLCGERARARGLVEGMKRRPDAYDHGFRIAQAYAIFGEKDSAFVWLGRQRWTLGQLSGLSADGRMDTLRSDPRYPQLLRNLGLRGS